MLGGLPVTISFARNLQQRLNPTLLHVLILPLLPFNMPATSSIIIPTPFNNLRPLIESTSAGSYHYQPLYYPKPPPFPL